MAASELVGWLKGRRKTPNAAPEWQASPLEHRQVMGGGLTTQGACYAGFWNQQAKDRAIETVHMDYLICHWLHI
jgi:hypothetical protein